MRLPDRSAAEEDAFVSSLIGAPTDDLVVWVAEAMGEGRVSLAARIVGLVDEDATDDPAVLRARAAARFVLHRRLGPEDVSWAEMEDALRALHRERIDRAKYRQRLRADGDNRRVGRLDSGVSRLPSGRGRRRR